MSRADFHATTALGLCLALTPLSVFAQTAPVPDGAMAFTPPFAACVLAPTIADCAEFRDILTVCADTLDKEQCQSLFVGPEIFADPAQLENAQALLTEMNDALTQLDPTEAEAGLAPESAEPPPGAEPAPEPATPDEVIPEEMELTPVEPEADAATDQTMSEPVAEAEPLVDVDETADLPAADPDPVDESAGAPVAQAEPVPDLVEPMVPAEADTATNADPLPQDTAETAPAESEAPQAEPPAETAPAAIVESEPETGTDAAPPLENAPVAEAASDDAALEEERARLRAEAEALAAEEPELVVEEPAAEAFDAPADELQDLDAEQQGALDRLMEAPEIAAAVAVLGGLGATDGAAPGGAAAALSALDQAADGDTEIPLAEVEEVIEDEIIAAEVRLSSDDFGSALSLDFDEDQARSDDNRDLERAGLIALGALAIGMIVERNRVVARSDERVVVIDDAGEYAVWRDDDVMLLQDGSDRRIERYSDGSTLTRWDRADGSQIITVRDATGRLLWRELVLPDGTSIELVNDMGTAEPIDVSTLPAPVWRELRISERTDPELALALLREAEVDARAVDRTFSLRQVRDIREVRELVPVLSPDPITFETDRANVRAEEAGKLAQVGLLMQRLIADNPAEVFLIEGHTDATGHAAYNLALSDRRAESVALALTEFFAIPPENLIIQGFGERYLRIPTAAAEEGNRRVAIRRVTPLLRL